MKDIQRETSGDAVSKKLPKLGDNMDSDEDDDDDDGEEEPDNDYEKGQNNFKVRQFDGYIHEIFIIFRIL